MTPYLPDVRILRLLTAVQWAALAVGMLGSIISSGASEGSLAASVLSAVYVVALTALPRRYLTGGFVVETASVAGVLLTSAAVALTGGVTSPYLLLSFMPPIRATLLGTTRIGAATGLLSAGLLIAITLSEETPGWSAAFTMSGLYLLVVLVVAYIQRLLREIQRNASELEASSEQTARRLEVLERTHDMLEKLSALIQDTDLTAVELGRAALDTLVSGFPGSAALAAVENEQGSSVIARAGEETGLGSTTVIPLRLGGRRVGRVELVMPEAMDEKTRAAVEASLHPLTVALANLQMLEGIATTAVQKERIRLARDLHDEIGPSLASMGLSLDLALLENPGNPGLTIHLQQLRGSVSRLVDEVRSTVADLRAVDNRSLRSHLVEIIAGLDGGEMGVDMELDERRPPRPSLLEGIAAILGEAIRNALGHSGASRTRVAGWCDFDRGWIVVEDDGSGFDPAEIPSGHFGLLGMKERGEDLGILVDLRSSSAGTRITVSWGEAA